MSHIEPPRTVDITQGSLVSKLLRHGSLYFVSKAIASFINILLIPIETRIFSPTEYGTIVTITSAVRVMAVFIGLSLDSAFVRYYHEYKDNSDLLKRETSTTFWFMALWGGIVVVAGLVGIAWFKPDLPVWPTLTLAVGAALLLQLGMLSQAYLQQNHRSGLQVTITLIYLGTNVSTMLLMVLVFGSGVVGKFIGTFCGAAIFLVLGTLILTREGLLRFTFSKSMLTEGLRYSLPLLPNAAAGWIAGYSDRLLLSKYGPIAETGVYNVGYSLGMALSLFSQSVFMVYGPMIFAMMKKDPNIARQRIERFIPYYFSFMLWLWLTLALFAQEIVNTLTPSGYESAASVVPIILFAYFLGSQYQTFIAALSFERKTALISAGAILQAFVNLGLNLVLIPLYGKTAAAWTTVLAIGIYTAWAMFWSQRSFALNINLRRIAITALVIGGAALTYVAFINIMSSAPTQIETTFKISLSLGVLFILWFVGGIEPSDKIWLKARATTLISRHQ